jgi:hypothetical protein
MAISRLEEPARADPPRLMADSAAAAQFSRYRRWREPAFRILTGRYVTAAFRQMWSFKTGFRKGAGAVRMMPVVKDLSEQDMIDLAAYSATLQP